MEPNVLPVEGDDTQRGAAYDPIQQLENMTRRIVEQEAELKGQTAFSQLCSMISFPVSIPETFYNLLLRDFLPFVQLLAASKALSASSEAAPNPFYTPYPQCFNNNQTIYQNPAASNPQANIQQAPILQESPLANLLKRKKPSSPNNDENEPEDLSMKKIAKRKHLPPTGLDPKTYRQKAQMRCLCVYRKPRPASLPYVSLEELGWSVEKLVKGQKLLLFINKWVKQPLWISASLCDIVREDDGTPRIAYKSEDGRVNWIGHVPCKECFTKSICVLVPSMPKIVYPDPFLINHVVFVGQGIAKAVLFSVNKSIIVVHVVFDGETLYFSPIRGVITFGIKASLSGRRVLLAMKTIIILISFLPIVNSAQEASWPKRTNPPDQPTGGVQASKGPTIHKYVKCFNYQGTTTTTSTIAPTASPAPATTPSLRDTKECPGGCKLAVYSPKGEFYSECPYEYEITEADAVCLVRPGRARHEADFACYCTYDYCNSPEEMKAYFPNETFTVSPSRSISVSVALVSLAIYMF